MSKSTEQRKKEEIIQFRVRPIKPPDRKDILERIKTSWGADFVVAHGEVFHPVELHGFIAESCGYMVGLITYNIREKACEIITLDSWREDCGVGTALVQAVCVVAKGQKCRRLWLVTTNDNIHALHFYQKRGFLIAGIRLNEMARARILKPQIPTLGQDGIPIRDEIEMEIILEQEFGG